MHWTQNGEQQPRDSTSQSASGTAVGQTLLINGSGFFDSFKSLLEHIDHGIEPGVEYILSVARLYDFDPSTPGNGYRSLVRVVERCCSRLLSLTRYLSVNRDSFLFRNDHYSREVN